MNLMTSDSFMLAAYRYNNSTLSPLMSALLGDGMWSTSKDTQVQPGKVKKALIIHYCQTV